MNGEYNGMGPDDISGEETLSGLSNGISNGFNSAQSLARGVGKTVNKFKNSGDEENTDSDKKDEDLLGSKEKDPNLDKDKPNTNGNQNGAKSNPTSKDVAGENLAKGNAPKNMGNSSLPENNSQLANNRKHRRNNRRGKNGRENNGLNPTNMGKKQQAPNLNNGSNPALGINNPKKPGNSSIKDGAKKNAKKGAKSAKNAKNAKKNVEKAKNAIQIFMKLPLPVKVIIIVIIAIIILTLFILLLLAGDDQDVNTNGNSYGTSYTYENVSSVRPSGQPQNFINANANYTESCTTSDGKEGYQVLNGVAGPEITNSKLANTAVTTYIDQSGIANYFNKTGNYYTFKAVDENEETMCIPSDVLLGIQSVIIEKVIVPQVDANAKESDLALTYYQTDALVAGNYSDGRDSSDSAISAYKKGDYSTLWKSMKGNSSTTLEYAFAGPNNNVMLLSNSLKIFATSSSSNDFKSRKRSEYSLFVTGDYSRTKTTITDDVLNDYDNYKAGNILDYQAIAYSSSSSKSSGTYTSLTCGSSKLSVTKPKNAWCAAGIYRYFQSFLPTADPVAWSKFSNISGDAKDYYFKNRNLGANGFKMDKNPDNLTAGTLIVYFWLGSPTTCGNKWGSGDRNLCGHIQLVESNDGNGNLTIFECNTSRYSSYGCHGGGANGGCCSHPETVQYYKDLMNSSNYDVLGFIHVLGDC